MASSFTCQHRLFSHINELSLIKTLKVCWRPHSMKQKHVQEEEGESKGVSGKSPGPIISKPGLNSLLCSLLTVWPWVNHHPSLVPGLFVSCNRCSLGSCTALKVCPIHLEVKDALCKDQCSWEHLSSKVGGGTTLSLWDGLFLGHRILLKTFSETCGVILFTKDEHQNTKRRKNTP